jgi:hypothetical protein
MAAPSRPLGMPPGSVRAILALMVVGVVIRQSLIGQPVGLLLTETLLIILAHYFASRRMVELPADLRQTLEREGVLTPEPNPLWLPRHSVRIIIVLAFLAGALALSAQGRLFEPGALGGIGLFFAYLGGVVVRWLKSHWLGSRFGAAKAWVHGKALVALAAGTALAWLTVSGTMAELPGAMEKGLLAIVLYYFGSR